MFYKHSGTDNTTILIVYVDDIVLTRNETIETKDLKSKLISEFEIKGLGALKFYLKFARFKEGIFMN